MPPAMKVWPRMSETTGGASGTSCTCATRLRSAAMAADEAPASMVPASNVREIVLIIVPSSPNTRDSAKFVQ